MLHQHMIAMPLSLCLEIDIVSSDTINAGKEDLRRWVCKFRCLEDSKIIGEISLDEQSHSFFLLELLSE